VARNHCLQKLRREKRSVRLENSERIMETAPLVHLLSEGTDEEALGALERCLEKLPEAQAVSIRLFFYEKQSYTDIADATAYGVKAVKSYIQNGKRNLKLCIERQGVAI
jgi:RNA polymerase sigma-70 factor (ECF subfamily)